MVDNIQYYAYMRANEKKNLRHSVTWFGNACIMYFTICFILNAIAVVLAGVLRNNAALSDDSMEILYSGFIYFFSTVLPLPIAFSVFAKCDGVKISESMSLGIKNKKAFWLCLGLIPMLIYIANLIFAFIGTVLGGFGITFNESEIDLGDNIYQKIFMLLIVSGLTPFVEEYAFRGVALTALRRYGDRFAIIVTAAMFGILHGSPLHACVAFVIGVLFAYAVIKTGSIWVSIILHAFNNFISMGMQFSDSDKFKIIFGLLYLLFIFAIGITALIFGILDRFNTFRREPLSSGGNVLHAEDKIASLANVSLLIAIILTIVYSLFASNVLVGFKEFAYSLMGV